MQCLNIGLDNMSISFVMTTHKKIKSISKNGGFLHFLQCY